MKFAHLADCHIGSWRDPKLRSLATEAFSRAVGMCIEKNVDFVLISGDLFDTSLPSIDNLKAVVIKLKELKDAGIAVYVIAGSHDFSPSGKTMLDVLEHAGLAVNVTKGTAEGNKLKLSFTVDKKTGAKITGMLGKKGMLEKSYYESLDKTNLEEEDGFKIFMLHSAITELKPEELDKTDSTPVSYLPKNFDYCAAGHVHAVSNNKLKGYGTIAYPGPLFPANFSELETLERGGFYIYDNGKLSYEPVQIVNTYKIKIKCDGKTPEQIKNELMAEIKNTEFNNTIVTIRLYGKISSGKISDIDFRDVYHKLYEKSAFFVMKNTSKLETEEFDKIKTGTASAEEIENSMVKEHLGQVRASFVSSDEENMVKKLMAVLSAEKEEGERVADFEKRINDEANHLLKTGI